MRRQEIGEGRGLEHLANLAHLAYLAKPRTGRLPGRLPRRLRCRLPRWLPCGLPGTLPRWLPSWLPRWPPRTRRQVRPATCDPRLRPAPATRANDPRSRRTLATDPRPRRATRALLSCLVGSLSDCRAGCAITWHYGCGLAEILTRRIARSTRKWWSKLRNETVEGNNY